MINIYGIDIGNYNIVVAVNEYGGNATKIVENPLSEKCTRYSII